jgi:hypothetical protein
MPRNASKSGIRLDQTHGQMPMPGQGARQASILTKEEAAASEAALDSLVSVLGGKAQLLDTLAVACDVPEVEELLKLFLDPHHATISLRMLCSMAGLTVVDLFSAYKKAMVVKAQLVAFQAITDAILPVVQDVMKRAAPYTIPCYDCGATGQIKDPDAKPEAEGDPAYLTCPTCAGKKELLQLPDLDRQKVALELAQLVQKGSFGINLQQNNMTVPPPLPDASEGTGNLISLQHAVRELLSGPRQPLPTVDAEVIPPQAEVP